MAKKESRQAKPSVAAFISARIAESDKTQHQIASECGYDKPNIMTMFKQGKTRVPLNKVGPLATALGVDPALLLRLTLAEYAPETWEAIDRIAGRSLISENEMDLVRAFRTLAGSAEFQFDKTRDSVALRQLAQECANDTKTGTK